MVAMVSLLTVCTALSNVTQPVDVSSDIRAKCKAKGLEVDCKLTDVPVIKTAELQALINTTALEVDINLFVGKHEYYIWHLSAHNPQGCISALEVAKLCAKVEDLEWANRTASGKIYLGIGLPVIGIRWFRIAKFKIPFLDGVAVLDDQHAVGQARNEPTPLDNDALLLNSDPLPACCKKGYQCESKCDCCPDGQHCVNGGGTWYCADQQVVPGIA